MKLLHYTLAFFAITVMSCSSNSSEQNKQTLADTTESQAKITDMLPDFSVIDSEGNTVNLSSLKGKKVFVNLWATWCPPCRREIPSIEKLYQKANKEKVVFVLLSLDDNFEIAKKYAEKYKLKAPVYYPNQDLPPLFNVDAIPTTFIFNEKAELVRIISGSDDFASAEYINLLK
jgi:thiol-disulfide isomerase/thioredoxin